MTVARNGMIFFILPILETGTSGAEHGIALICRGLRQSWNRLRRLFVLIARV
jgi:hypothetical protein